MNNRFGQLRRRVFLHPFLFTQLRRHLDDVALRLLSLDFGSGFSVDSVCHLRNRPGLAWSARGNPAQSALLECPIFEVFFGGARGGGKTDGMLGEWVRHADLYGEHAIGLMLRRTRTELIETIERSRAIYSLMGWTYNETDKMWRATNGARLRFAYLERDADAELYQGHNYTRLYVE